MTLCHRDRSACPGATDGLRRNLRIFPTDDQAACGRRSKATTRRNVCKMPQKYLLPCHRPKDSFRAFSLERIQATESNRGETRAESKAPTMGSGLCGQQEVEEPNGQQQQQQQPPKTAVKSVSQKIHVCCGIPIFIGFRALVSSVGAMRCSVVQWEHDETLRSSML